MRSRGRKLDRFLFNGSWLEHFPNCSVELLNRSSSDHSPLLLRYSQVQDGPKPFRFQNMWLRRPEFQDVVRSSWSSPVDGYGMYRFSVKLRRLKGDFKVWNRTTFGDLFANVRQAEEEVKHLEGIYDCSHSEEDLIRLNNAQATLYRCLSEEEDFWRQKARLKWIKEGDRNTRLFHASVVEKRQRLDRV